MCLFLAAHGLRRDRAMNKDVRSKAGDPIIDDFANSDGTPIVIDTTALSGSAHFVDDGGNIREVGDRVTNIYVAEHVIIDKTSGDGIKIDTANPTYPWMDKEGLLYPDATAGPVRGTFITGVSAYAYTGGKEMDFSFHMPHDWAVGTDLYIHVHWGHNANTSVSGNVVFNFNIIYAKGHNQANFASAVSPSITYALTNISTTPRYRHRIDEIQLSAASPSATQLDTDNLEVDGLIQGTVAVNLSGATLTTTSPVNSIYIFTIDLHYQSTGIGTKNKAPNFYS